MLTPGSVRFVDVVGRSGAVRPGTSGQAPQFEPVIRTDRGTCRRLRGRQDMVRVSASECCQGFRSETDTSDVSVPCTHQYQRRLA
jgi:hypothetical protein